VFFSTFPPRTFWFSPRPDWDLHFSPLCEYKSPPLVPFPALPLFLLHSHRDLFFFSIFLPCLVSMPPPFFLPLSSHGWLHFPGARVIRCLFFPPLPRHSCLRSFLPQSLVPPSPPSFTQLSDGASAFPLFFRSFPGCFLSARSLFSAFPGPWICDTRLPLP